MLWQWQNRSMFEIPGQSGHALPDLRALVCAHFRRTHASQQIASQRLPISAECLFWVIASFWPAAYDFRSTAVNGHSQVGRHFSDVPRTDSCTAANNVRRISSETPRLASRAAFSRAYIRPHSRVSVCFPTVPPWSRSVWRVCDTQCPPTCFRAIGSNRFPDD
jgi:hypothetical protein